MVLYAIVDEDIQIAKKLSGGKLAMSDEKTYKIAEFEI